MAKWIYTKKRKESLEEKARPKHSLYVKLGKELYEKKHGK